MTGARTMEPRATMASRAPALSRLLGLFGLCVLVSAVLHLLAFHPFYFGDELFNFSVAQAKGMDFLRTFSSLDSYKPRFFFNAVWALIATSGWPRSVPMAISTVLLSACLIVACLLAGLRNRKAVPVQVLLVAAIVTCRFSAMLPFDYVASIIEYSSLGFFLSGLYLLARHGFADAPDARIGSIVLALFAAAIFSHERYVAPVFSVGAVLCLWGLAHRRAKTIAWGVVLGAAAPLLFILLSKLISVVPLTTGTAGLSVTVGGDTFRAAGIYLANIFGSASLGHEWYFAKLPPGAMSITIVVLSLGALAAWASGFFRHREWTATTWYLLASMFALLLIACLPGTARQEARWAFPVFVVFSILVATHSGYWARLAMLATLLLGNLLFLLEGSPANIYNIIASTNARNLSLALNHVKPPGRVGLIIGAKEPDVSWMLGGGLFGPGLSATPGVQFSRLNLPHGVHVFRSPSDAMAKIGEAPDFGVMQLGGGMYAFMDRAGLQVATSGPGTSMGPLRKLGGDGAWGGWILRGLAPNADGTLYLTNRGDGFFRLPSQELDGRKVVYRMRSATGRPAEARLQVNWMGKGDSFLAAAINVVEVNGSAKDYSMFLIAPVGATEGNIFVTLASPSDDVVHVEYVGVGQ